jgi:hypothetical protein
MLQSVREWPMSEKSSEADQHIAAFEHVTLRPLQLQAHPQEPARFQAQVVFSVRLRIDPNVGDPALYEYRQMVRGSGYTHRGQWVNGSWEVMQVSRPGDQVQIVQPQPIASAAFQIPDIHPSRWREDAIVDPASPTVQRFGHREALPIQSPMGTGRYSDDGYVYECERTAGIEAGEAALGLRVSVMIQFKGVVVRFDKPPNTPGRRIVASIAEQQWNYACDSKIGSLTPFIAVE